jgi:hypothetical protein
LSPTASIVARVAGAVAALGFILGAVDGPIVAVVGALALVAFGRALAAPAGTVFIGPLAFAVVAGATGVVALRWSSLEVPAIRGIQAVLGPTVAVEPRMLAAAAGVAFGAGVVAAGVWLADDLGASGLGRRWRWVEIVTVSLVLATLFAGPEPAGAIEAGIAAAAVAAATVLVALVGRAASGRSARVAGAVTVIAGGLVAGAAGVVGSLG